MLALYIILGILLFLFLLTLLDISTSVSSIENEPSLCGEDRVSQASGLFRRSPKKKKAKKDKPKQKKTEKKEPEEEPKEKSPLTSKTCMEKRDLRVYLI